MENVDLSIRKIFWKKREFPFWNLWIREKLFSKPKVGKPPIQLLPSALEGTQSKPLHQVNTRVHTAEVSIARLYVPPEHIEDARLLMRKLTPTQTQTSLL